jgi:hypothetical protein
MTSISYIDASALVKLVVDEAESPSMHRWFVESGRLATSAVGMIETRRAASRHPHDPGRLESILRSMVVLHVDENIAGSASRVPPLTLRTLDAIHLATALMIGAEIDAFVTYDDRLAAAARDIGLPVVRPA